jgi:hypothetical protein
MADKRITQLNPLSNLAGEDLFAVVDVDAQETKKTTYADLTGSLRQDIVTSYGLYSQTGSSVPITGITGVSTATSGSLLSGGIGTLTVPANGFQKGDTFHAKLAGKVNMANSHTLDIQFRADGNVLADTGIISMPKTTDNQNWILDITFVIREIGTAGNASILTSGMFTVRKDAAGEVVSEIFSFVNSTTFDTTVDNTLNVIGVMGPNCISTENIYSELFTLNKVY